MICAVSISETESKTQLSILCIYHIHIFFHPDFTVGLGISPNHALRLVGYTTGRESHPALKIIFYFYVSEYNTLKKNKYKYDDRTIRLVEENWDFALKQWDYNL